MMQTSPTYVKASRPLHGRKGWKSASKIAPHLGEHVTDHGAGLLLRVNGMAVGYRL